MNTESATPQTYQRGKFDISTDARRLDLDFIHDYLARRSYWAAGIPRDVMERSLQHSMCFGVYDGLRQIGFGRVITDRATFAYLADVFIEEAYRGMRLGVWLVETVLAHPELQGLRRFMLATRDAHGLYAQFGFTAPAKPQNLMEKHWANVYDKTAQPSVPPAPGGCC